MPKKENNPAELPVEESTADRNAENKAVAEQAVDAGILAYNAALALQDIEAMQAADAAIEKALGEFAEAAECEVFAICKAEDHPLRKAAELHSFRVLKVSAKREDKILTGYVKGEKEKPIDLAKLAAKCGLPTLWTHDVESLNQLLTLRVAQEMGASAAELKSIAKSYFMTRGVVEIEAGKTPTSNTQLVKRLQEICDKILGENVARANNHDLAYIIAAHTKKGKARISVNTAKHDFMRRLILDVLHRCITGAAYEVEFKTFKA